MNTLSSATLRNLAKLRATDSLWEGDRRPLPRRPHTYHEGPKVIHLAHSRDQVPECILWVDATKGVVRAMDVVDPHTGQEAFVRSLLQAMERPQGPAQPALPKTILVRDRQLQFYLRGILQDLDIRVEYAEQLPLIDEIFSNMIETSTAEPPLIPPAMARGLLAQSAQLWHNAPWERLWDHQVIAIEMNCWDVEHLFAVVMGHMGLERGVILYRSYASLVQFRQKLLSHMEDDIQEETFLGQDCLFNLFDETEEQDSFLAMHGWSISGIQPIFGSLHPLEGGRSHLYEEEAMAMTIALQALNQFYGEHYATFRKKTKLDRLPQLRSVYEITSPEGKHQITVQTMPELAEELLHLVEETEVNPLVRHDLWAGNTLFKLQELDWEQLDTLKTMDIHKQLADYPRQGMGISTLLIQTTRLKAENLLQAIHQRGGIQGITFQPGESPFGDRYELGIVILGNGEMQLFAEFAEADQKLNQQRRQWQQRCADLHNYCAITLAMGVTGSARGKPQLKHYLGLWEVPLIPPKELGLGVLQAYFIP